MLFEFIHPVMRKSLNLLFGIVLVVATATTLSCRVAILGGAHIPPLPNDELLLLPPNPLNSTLLHFAAIDIGELKARQEIQHLLEPNFAHPRQRSISSWRIENHLDPLHAQPQLRLTTNTGIPFALRSPKYNGKWFQFRKNLAAWFRNKHFQSQIIFHLLDLVKRPLDRHYRFAPTSDHRYASCAVVGNSGILLNNQYGDLIDAHHIVIRLNNARTKGYHQNVGSKTSISFINSNILHLCARREGCFCHPYGETVPMLMYMCQPAHFMDYTICNSSHKAPLLITDARFDVLCARIVKYYSLKRFVEETAKSPEEWASTHDGSMFHYSSGMQAVVLALGTCDRVSLFGFGKSSAAKHHYHTNQKAELHLHDYEAEYAFYRDLVSGNKAIPFLPENFKIPPVVMYQ